MRPSVLELLIVLALVAALLAFSVSRWGGPDGRAMPAPERVAR